MAKNNVWLIVAVVAVIAVMSGWISLPSFGDNDRDIEELYPSTLKTSMTLNTGDKLATSATDTNVSYYVFDDAGNYLKEGTTSSGTASFDVPSGVNNYKILVWDDTSGTAEWDYLAEEIIFSTDGSDPTKRAEQTINVDLYRESNVTLKAVRDPIDLNANVSATAGSTVAFEVLYQTEISNAAANKPVIMVDVNTTEVETVSISGLTSTPCPDRIATDGGRKFYCFEDNKILLSSEGIQSVSGTFKVASAVTPSTTSEVVFRIIDSGMYRESDYKTAGYSAFKKGTENPVTNADIGARDSIESNLDFAG